MEISIKDLVSLLCELADFTGEILWDDSKPDGQMKRRLDVSRAKKEFSFQAEIDFKEGLRKTMEWYKEHPRDEHDT